MKQDVEHAFVEYKEAKRRFEKEDISMRCIKKAKGIYPFTQLLLKLITILGGEKVVWLKKENENTYTNKTIIFANTHRFKPDFEKITIKTKRPSFVIASDFKNSYKTISGWYFNTRPTIFIDPYSKEDREVSYKMMKKYLIAGLDCTIFPEAVWNLSENKPILETFYGSVRAALETNSALVCTAIERYGKVYVLNRSSIIDFEPIVKKHTDCSFCELDYTCKEVRCIYMAILEECNSIMRDTMATLLWEIWEEDAKKNGVVKRKELADNYWTKFIDKLISEWPGYQMKDNIEQRFHSRFELELERVKKDLASIQPTMQNAFLFDKRLKGKLRE